MWGLAWRWPMSRSVKNACTVAVIAVIADTVLAAGVEPVDGLGEQLRRGLEIPVGVRRGDVAQIGGQQRQPGGDVAAVAIPVQQGVHREGVPQIMRAGPATR